MAKLTIMGVKTSPPCRAVMLTASAIKVEYVLENVDMSDNKHLRNEKLLKHNELAKVPVLLIGSGDKSIADSHAINPYLIDEHSSKDDSLYPKDPYKRAKIDRMLHFDSAELFPRLDALFRTQCYTKNLEPLKPDHIKNFLEVLSMLEKMLENKKYLCEDRLTLADLTCVATVSSAIGVVNEIQENKYKNVLNWVKRLEELPYYQAANGAGAKELRDYVNKRIQAYEDSTKTA